MSLVPSSPQGPAGLKGGEGPQGPPGPVVSTVLPESYVKITVFMLSGLCWFACHLYYHLRFF